MLLRPLSRVILTPAWLAGIINLRGDVVAVIALARLLGQAPTPLTDDSRIVITRHEPAEGRTRTAGVLVDRMAELRTLPLDALQPPPTTLAADAAELLRGIATLAGGAALRILDLPALFESERLIAFRRPS
jgi:purine-binding chemotaxis protein CheW